MTITRLVAPGTESPARQDYWNGTVANVPLLYESETGPCRGSLEFVSPEGIRLDISFQFNSSTDKSLNTYSFRMYGFTCRHVRGTLTISNLSIPTLTVLKDTTWNLPPVNIVSAPYNKCQLVSYHQSGRNRFKSTSEPWNAEWKFNTDSNFKVLLNVRELYDYNFLEDLYSMKKEGEWAQYTKVVASLEAYNLEIKPRLSADGRLIYVIKSGTVLAFRVFFHEYKRWMVSNICPATMDAFCGNNSNTDEVTTDNPCTFTSDYLIAEIAPNV